jgi:hypothetical protein
MVKAPKVSLLLHFGQLGRKALPYLVLRGGVEVDAIADVGL